MADEIRLDATLQFLKGRISDTFTVAAKTANMSGVNYIRNAMSVPTTATGTLIPLGSVGTPGWFMIRNTDPTNYVEIMTSTTSAKLLKLLPDEYAIGRFTVAAPAAIANTASCIIDYLIIDT